jgi:hypothetical protein
VVLSYLLIALFFRDQLKFSTEKMLSKGPFALSIHKAWLRKLIHLTSNELRKLLVSPRDGADVRLVV